MGTSNSWMTTSSTTPTALLSPSSSLSSSSTPHLPSSTFPLSSGPGPITTAWAPASGRPDLNRFFSSIDELGHVLQTCLWQSADLQSLRMKSLLWRRHEAFCSIVKHLLCETQLNAASPE